MIGLKNERTRRRGEGRFVLAEKKVPGMLFYVIHDGSQEELEKFISWVETKYPEYSPVEVSFTEDIFGEDIYRVIYLTVRSIKPPMTSRIPISLYDFPVYVRLENQITVLGKSEMEMAYIWEPLEVEP